MLEQSFDWSREWMSEWMADPKNRGGVLCNTSQCSLSVTRLFYTQTLCRTVEALKRRLVAYWVPPRAWTFTGQAGCNRCGWGGSSSSNTLHCSVHVIPTQISVLLNIDVFYPNLKMGAVKVNNVLNFIVHLWTMKKCVLPKGETQATNSASNYSFVIFPAATSAVKCNTGPQVHNEIQNIVYFHWSWNLVHRVTQRNDIPLVCQQQCKSVEAVEVTSGCSIGFGCWKINRSWKYNI